MPETKTGVGRFPTPFELEGPNSVKVGGYEVHATVESFPVGEEVNYEEIDFEGTPVRFPRGVLTPENLGKLLSGNLLLLVEVGTLGGEFMTTQEIFFPKEGECRPYISPRDVIWFVCMIDDTENVWYQCVV